MTMAPLRLYVSPHYRVSGMSHIPLLYPFWGIPEKQSMPYVYAAMQKHQYSTEDYALVSTIDEADFVVMPHPYWRLMQVRPALVQTIINDAHAAGKLVLIEAAGDFERPLTIPNAVILRLSQYRYAVSPQEITIPFLAEDLLEAYAGGTLIPRTKTERPSVGFAGWSGMPLARRIKTAAKELPITLASLVDSRRGAEHKGLFFRERALAALTKHPAIDAKIRARATYSGHVATRTGSEEDNRQEFVHNLLESDYALCVRGDANSSVRFYEALSLGKIPLFLDTACVLPLEDRINYRDFSVFVDWRDTDRIGDILAAFHAQVSPEKFEDMQRQARQAFREHLRMDSFAKELAGLLHARLKESRS